MRKKAVVTLLIATAFSMSLLSGCGGEKKENGPETENGSGDSDNGAGAGTDTESAGDAATDSIVGEWEFAYSIYHLEDGDGYSNDIFTLLTDEYAPDSAAIIRKEGDDYITDYKFAEYETYTRIYGAGLEYKEGAPYEGDDAPSWYFELDDPMAEEGTVPLSFGLIDNDTIVVSSIYEDDDPDYYFKSIERSYYFRKGDARFDDAEELRYFDTVTVSSAEELLSSIQNNRKIILKEGEYNLQYVPKNAINNEHVGDPDSYNSDCTLYNVSNLCIEAKEGEDVLISIDDPYMAVLAVNYGQNITLRGLTCGHNVEPGYCSGSVLYFCNSSNVTIEDCSLFGSGTYGIETCGVYDLNVTDTDIYECTYGLVSLYSGGSCYFKDCTMRDSSDLSMIYVNDMYDVVFEDCEFSGNRADAFDLCYFVEQGEYDRVTFKRCDFKNNIFNVFSRYEVELEDCTSDNNRADFADLINSSASAFTEDDIRDEYQAAIERQKEIDYELDNNALLAQLDLNQYAFEEYDIWDGLLNRIWGYLKDNLDESEMENLKEAQQKWIREKEAAMKEAGADFEGGSMQPMLEYSKGAELTRKRVEELMGAYFAEG